MKRVLITGATGVLGAEILGRLKGLRELEAIAVSRRGNPARGVIAWHIGREPAPAPLRRRFDVIVHMAADTRWNQAPHKAWAANAEATAAVLALADHDTHFVHASTAFAVSARGDSSSDRLADYRNTYEWSKAAAERLVARHARSTIVRPPLIIGRRSDGYVERFSGLYVLTRAWVAGLVPAIVGEPKSVVEIVPVDDVAAAVVAAMNGNPVRDPIVLGAGAEALTTEDLVAAALQAVNGWRHERGASQLPPPPIISAQRWERFFLPFARTTLSERQLRTIDLLGEFIPYLSMPRPPRPTALVPGVRAAVSLSIRYWARTHPHTALAEPRPWTAGPAVTAGLPVAADCEGNRPVAAALG